MSKAKIAAKLKFFEKEIASELLENVEKEGSAIVNVKQTLIDDVRSSYEEVAGGPADDPKVQLTQVFAKVMMGPDYEIFGSAYFQGGQADIRNHRIDHLLGRLQMEFILGGCKLANCSEAQEWDNLVDACRTTEANLELWTAVAVQAETLLKDDEIAEDVSSMVELNLFLMRSFQLLAVLEAPAADVTKIWSQEDPTTVKLYSKALKIVAAQRGDAEVTAAVDALTAVQPAPAKKAAKKLPAPKK